MRFNKCAARTPPYPGKTEGVGQGGYRIILFFVRFTNFLGKNMMKRPKFLG